ncbi:CoA pyrophosphatase [Alteraurantiacibacter aquimixticola]|uniref:CoA pyrophosphatase n=1 Tax=Alteraurantiacibacter aquimixticola TaxID=2489173 RepID=A0A4T3F7V5_9SPHN|nr:CoA pyrophosphatase [Alteraurantiacibacter aquimixticola]TIX51812.1 CoA pyrophosphatase [Alteraurantiacibacter aquimixticola]
MSPLFERVSVLFEQTHHVGLKGLHDDGRFIPERVRPAAVLIAVTDRSEPGVILTHRPKTMASHPGQVAFPGGKLEAGETPIEAALREAEEELSITPSHVSVVGEAARFATGSGYEVTPVLGVVPSDLPIVPDPREVDSWFEAPLRFVLDPANHEHKVGLFRGHQRPYIEINWNGHRIWGITAGILSNLSHRLAFQDLLP